MMFYLAAFLTGFLGSFHCVGMCAPIALALPKTNQNKWHILKDKLLYNFGRIITYSFLGILVGLLGRGLMLTSTQQWLSIGIGVLILVFLSLPKRLTYHFEVLRPLQKTTLFVKAKLIKLFKQKKTFTTFLIGFFNGFLPCGLVYLALAGAIATGGILEGTLYMFWFGLGTLPMMLLVSLAGNFIKPTWRKNIFKAVPVFATMLALFLIVRGLNLGIPYLSPKVTAQTNQMECCHK